METLALGQGDPGLDTLTNNENVGDSGSKSSVQRILDVDNIETSNVLFAVHNDTSTTHVTTTSDHDNVASVKLDKVGDFALLKIELDSVVDLDERIGITDGAAVVGNDVGDTTSTESDLLDFEELVGSLFRSDAVNGESALDIVEETEVFVGLFDGDDIHEPCRICRIGANLAVDFNQTLLDDSGDFTASQSVL